MKNKAKIKYRKYSIRTLVESPRDVWWGDWEIYTATTPLNAVNQFIKEQYPEENRCNIISITGPSSNSSVLIDDNKIYKYFEINIREGIWTTEDKVSLFQNIYKNQQINYLLNNHFIGYNDDGSVA